ncbi:Ubiquitin domain-containing protein 2, partial [Cucurbita argyrosperma subsp. sororia]
MGCAGSSQTNGDGILDDNQCKLICCGRESGSVGLVVLNFSIMNWIALDFIYSVIALLDGVRSIKKICKPKSWKHPQPITRSQLVQLREEFWDTAPHYGGRKEIWDALRAAAEAELSLAQAIIDSAGVIIQNADLTICYDERGAKYELPNYVLSEPTNLIRDSS